MGEAIEALMWVFGGIYWMLLTAYEKSTGRNLGLLGTLLLLVFAAVLCSGVVFVLCHLLFPA